MKKTRLDVYLAGQHLEQSRSEIQRMITNGFILVNGEPRKPSYLLKGGEKIEVKRRSPPPPPAGPEAIPLDLLHEDEAIIVINKPAGLVVHPATGNYSGTLVNALLHHLQKKNLPPELSRCGLVHRLDKGTSGVMVIAKTEEAQRDLANQFKNRVVEKTYLALVFGPVAKKEGRIEIPIGRDQQHRRKFSSRSRYTRQATTLYRVKKEFNRLSLLEVFPKTGRTHQIRVHLSEIGHPIVGDIHYGAKSRLSTIKDEENRNILEQMTRPFLHAASLSFVHPSHHNRVSFSAPLPLELQHILDLVSAD
ncbi:MAG: RluA family pseudouridine synthase [Deltaproteobacteria bacterium]|nr:RluA family pseudouridine synthase [Deltaproteobacteria bacterium]